MSTVVLSQDVRIPSAIDDLDSFRAWAATPEFPTRGRYSFLHGEIWVDLSMEQPFTHNRVKLRMSMTLDTVATADALGYVFADRMLFSHEAAEFATEPDALFVSFASLQTGQVHFVEAVGDGYREIVGTPELVLEVVSAGSVRKDTVELLELYWVAGIPEYWLVDVRAEPHRFDILKRGAKGYTTTRRAAGGWLKSGVFGRAFRLTQQVDPLGNPQFNLEVR